MDGTKKTPILATFIVAVALLLVSGAKSFAYPADEAFIGDADPNLFPDSNNYQQEGLPFNLDGKSKSCFHFHMSRNMSALLSDATKMLQHVRDRREREWIITFIYRIKSLAEHLRSHPESRNYECLSYEDGDQINSNPPDDPLKSQQQELYFVDDTPRMKRSNDQPDNKDRMQAEPVEEGHDEFVQLGESSPPTKGEELEGKSVQSDLEQGNSQPAPKPEHVSTEVESMQSDGVIENAKNGNGRPFDKGILLSSPPDCEAKKKCDEFLRNRKPTDGLDADVLVQHVHTSNEEVEEERQERLKETIRKALIEEIGPEFQKFRTVGGSIEDLMKLWKESEGKTGETKYSKFDFDFEENGAAAGDPRFSDKFSTSDPTVAPSMNDIRKSKKMPVARPFEPYDDSDVLVKQLFDIRYEPARPRTRKPSDDQGEYLITSASVPF